MTNRRIDLLDSFRFLAVMGVLLYHYTWMKIPLYPYGGFFGPVFRYGYLGVQFFFMISGFVISYTLHNTGSFAAFARNRFSRLFPPMLLCSLVTFLVLRCIDDRYLFPNAHVAGNFLPGLTFINPQIWTRFTGAGFQWLNGSYWSLWTEIQFYVIAACIYFLSKKHFFRNMLLAGMAISLSKYIPLYFLKYHPALSHPDRWNAFFYGWKYINELFNITFFLIWFLPGVVFYRLYMGFRFAQDPIAGACSVILFFYLLIETRVFNATTYYVTQVAGLFMIAFFLVLIYKRKYLFFLDVPFFRRVGVISYTVYLIHEPIGVTLISKYGGLLGPFSPCALFIAIMMVIGFAELSYRFYETKAASFLKKRRRRPAPVA
jgi:peptidoglycan/LPS O-acetylase OafA/YrhL